MRSELLHDVVQRDLLLIVDFRFFRCDRPWLRK